MSPLASASAQVKSSPSLKIVEYDVFISRMPISRQTETIVESRMFAITMSTGALRGGAGGRASSTGSLGCTIFRRMSLRPVAFSADHSTHHSEQNSAGLSCANAVDAVAVDQHAAIVALDVLLDVVAVARKSHDALSRSSGLGRQQQIAVRIDGQRLARIQDGDRGRFLDDRRPGDPMARAQGVAPEHRRIQPPVRETSPTGGRPASRRRPLPPAAENPASA